MAEQKQPTPKYQNNSLAGVVKNQRESTKSDWRAAGQELKDFGNDVNDRLTRQGYATLRAGNDVVNAAKKAYNFVTSPAQEVETDAQRLERYMGQGYTTRKGSDFLYGPDGRVSNIKYDGSIGQLGKQATGLTATTRNLTPIGQTIGGDSTTYTPTPSQGTPTQTTPNNTPYNGAVTYSNYPNQGNQNGSQLKNADVNISQYGDDSSAKNYNNPALWGGENQKYSGEETKNSQVAYDPNATIEGLDPNYKYGWDAQVANSNEMNYIAKRNDQIASALYNAGLTSIEDVANFLYTQQGFENSNENERQNTINAIWKRIGQIQPQGQQQVDQQTTPGNPQSPGASIPDEQAKNGVIYGRASGEGDTRIETNADPFSPDAIQLRQRQANLTTLNSMDSYDIALTLNSGASIFGETAMRDLMTYNPQKYQEIQQYQKQLNGMANVNAIAKGGSVDVTAQTTSATDVVNSGLDNWIQQNSTERSYGDVKGIISDAMANSQTATTATQEMLNLNSQMAELQEELDNLPQTARKQFKGDVPQYIVDAYVSNNSQRIQSELNKLQTRYNATIDLYKTELSNKQRETEMMLKERQVNSDINYQNWQMANGNAKLNLERSKLNLDAQQQYWNQGYLDRKLNYDSIVEINGKSYIPDGNGGFTELSSTIAYQSYQNTVGEKLQSYMNMFPDGTDGGQCEQFTDSFTYSTTGLTMEGANGKAYTTAEEKESYVNSWIPEVGSVAVFDYGIVQDDGNNYGHTMLVSAYDPTTGLITLKGSNKSRKPNEFEKVYSQTMSLAELNSKGAFKGFWNPYLDKVGQSFNTDVVGTGGASSNSIYQYYKTPMQSMFQTAYAEASTKDLKDEIKNAEDSYAIMYELQSGGYIDKLVNSDTFNTLIQQIGNGKFGDREGNVDFKAIRDYAINKLKDEDIAYALDRFHRIIEKKLRKESGAAISQSEWNSNFDMYLPAVGQSPEYRRRKLIALERDIVAGQLPPKYRETYIGVIPEMGEEKGISNGRAIW